MGTGGNTRQKRRRLSTPIRGAGRADRVAQGGDEPAEPLGVQLQRHAVHDEARRDLQHLLLHHEPVRLQRLAGLRDVHDGVGEGERGGDLDRAVQRDDLSETAVTLAWHTAPHKSAKDLFDKELIVGGITGVDPEVTPKLYNSLLGTKFKVVTGYNSTAQIALAIERGEVHGIGDWSWSSLKAVRPNWLADKQVTLLMQGALQKEPELGGLPSALDFVKNDADRKVLELHFTQKTAARPLLAPPEVPPERVALLRKAFEDLAKDKEFLAEADKAGGEKKK